MGACPFQRRMYLWQGNLGQFPGISHQHLPSRHSQEMSTSVLRERTGQNIITFTTQSKIESSLRIFKLLSNTHTHTHTHREQNHQWQETKPERQSALWDFLSLLFMFILHFWKRKIKIKVMIAALVWIDLAQWTESPKWEFLE